MAWLGGKVCAATQAGGKPLIHFCGLSDFLVLSPLTNRHSELHFLTQNKVKVSIDCVFTSQPCDRGLEVYICQSCSEKELFTFWASAEFAGCLAQNAPNVYNPLARAIS